MYKKLYAWIIFPIMLIGMIWIIFAAVDSAISSSDNLNSTNMHSGWNRADDIIDDKLIGYDKALAVRTKLTLASGSKKVGNIYISRERLLREPESLDEESLVSVAKSINNFYFEYSVPICMTAFPEAAEIYTECLPENLNVPSQLDSLDVLYENVDSKIRIVDSYHVLSTFKEDYIYYRTDARCTVNGAYFLYRSLIRKMGYYPVPYDSCTISHMRNDIYGDLYDVCLYDKVTPDIIDIYTCENSSEIVSMHSFNGQQWSDSSFYDKNALDSGDAKSYYIGKPTILTEIETNVENEKQLLIFKDSYADNMLPFFTQHYSKIDIIDMNCLDRNISELVSPSDYQQVLILCDADTFADVGAFKYLEMESGNND